MGLLAHHTQQEAVWLDTYKNAVPDKYLRHEHVMDQPVAFGWTDGIRQRLDDKRSMQLISPAAPSPGPTPTRTAPNVSPARAACTPPARPASGRPRTAACGTP